jgi:hypothetical protein
MEVSATTLPDVTTTPTSLASIPGIKSATLFLYLPSSKLDTSPATVAWNLTTDSYEAPGGAGGGMLSPPPEFRRTNVTPPAIRRTSATARPMT